MLREQRDLTREALGGQTNFSKSTIGAFERGERIMDANTVVEMDKVLAAAGVLAVVAPFLEEERYAPQFRDFARFEAQAVSLWVYDTHMVNGLLQTADYARTVFAAHCPPVDEEEVERRVTARLARQALLGRRPLPLLCFVIEESVLLRRTGGERVWREQLLQLVEIGRLPHVRIQVVPLNCEEPVGSVGPMTLVEAPERRMLGYVEVQEWGTLISKRESVSAMVQRHASIRGMALNPSASARLIERLAGEQ
ncbi:helix-turn-helix transcriptional regulator [Streptomyces sp. A3M-1-3]|nr:helix-turn-helix transcriptional regulator [Streptomyces sp. A3M-1-3]